MLEKLFESVDEKVLTPELKQSLQESFDAAVETKSQEIADKIINEKTEALNAHCDDFKAQLESEKNAEVENLTESYEHKFDELKTNLSNYMDSVVEEFVNESHEALAESTKNAKAEALCEAFSNFVSLAGVDVANIVEARKNDLAEKYEQVNNKLVEAMNEVNSLKTQLDEARTESAKNTYETIVESFTKDMTIMQANQFATRAASLDVENFSDAFNKLNALRESVVANNETVTESVQNNSVDERLQRFL